MRGAPPDFALREGGRLWVHRRFDPVLRGGGLVSFDHFMKAPGAEILRKKGYTSNARLRIDGRDFYLKRYRFPRLGVALRGGLKANPARYSGVLELRNILRFRRADVATAVPVAAGDRREGRWGAGFILTEGIVGEASMEEVLPRRYAPPIDRDRGREKRRLARALGAWVRVLHRSGLHVRDLYLCHIYVPPEDPTERFRLIDLHRATGGRRVGRRRVVRDLAALHHSSPPGIITRADRLRVLLAVIGDRRLDGEAKALVRRVMARARRMEKHERGPGVVWSLIHAGVPSLRGGVNEAGPRGP